MDHGNSHRQFLRYPSDISLILLIIYFSIPKVDNFPDTGGRQAQSRMAEGKKSYRVQLLRRNFFSLATNLVARERKVSLETLFKEPLHSEKYSYERPHSQQTTENPLDWEILIRRMNLPVTRIHIGSVLFKGCKHGTPPFGVNPVLWHCGRIHQAKVYGN